LLVLEFPRADWGAAGSMLPTAERIREVAGRGFHVAFCPTRVLASTEAAWCCEASPADWGMVRAALESQAAAQPCLSATFSTQDSQRRWSCPARTLAFGGRFFYKRRPGLGFNVKTYRTGLGCSLLGELARFAGHSNSSPVDRT
jgi:hypothetical protein